MASKRHERLMVAAIDFGTTYSGYAFSFRHEHDRDPLRISANQWCAGSRGVISLKTSTCILFSPDQKFDSFGIEAEDKYSELALDEVHHDWYYFRRFKMILYGGEVRRDMMLDDDKGKSLPALDVFSSAIQYLKCHMERHCQDRLHGLADNEIQWVLTVPAIWSDGAKQFMREAAQMAGIDGENLVIALEPEAASMYCKHLPVERIKCSESNKITAFQPGSKYLVLDAGGGTVDITAHEVCPNGTLKELHKANGGKWGGTSVDQAFIDFLSGIVGQEVFQVFCNEHRVDFLDMCREFEIKKRTIAPDLNQKLTFKMPIALNEVFQNMTGSDIRQAILSREEFTGKLSWAGDKMRADPDLVKDFFRETCDGIVSHLQQMFQHPSVRDLRAILMVGGFSESPMLRDAIQKVFPEVRIIVPDEAGLAVLKGAVLFGHRPHTIASRVAKFTYGVKMYRDFIEGADPPEKKVNRAGRVKLQGAFGKHVEVGQSIDEGKALDEVTYCPGDIDSTYIRFAIYSSSETCPRFIDDESCSYIGKLIIDLTDTYGVDRPVGVKMIFGGTELAVEAREMKTGKTVSASFDFLENADA